MKKRSCAPGRRVLLLAGLVLVAGCPRKGNLSPVPPPPASESLPSKLDDVSFWRIVTDFSEPDGVWKSDNFLSDERPYQHVLPGLAECVPAGGVYIGVGPEQNFTYIAALRPKIAFIVDIRRGNLLEHLYYKALMEGSSDRADFLSKLFGRSRPEGLGEDAKVAALFAAYRVAASDEDLQRSTVRAAKDGLMRTHGFALSTDDLRGIDKIAEAFHRAGPDMDYNFPSEQLGSGRIGGEPFPTYAELMAETDASGAQRSFLATEQNFLAVVELQRKNAIVPLVGDFAGPKTLRAIGRYVADHRATVAAFYTSNVEVYLFRDDSWKRFYANVAAFPVDAKSTFIRFCSNGGPPGPGPGCATQLNSIAEQLKEFQAGEIQGYGDVLRNPR